MSKRKKPADRAKRPTPPTAQPKQPAKPARWVLPVAIVAVLIPALYLTLKHRPASPERPASAPAAVVQAEPLPEMPGLTGRRYTTRVQDKYDKRDPAKDGWDTEVFNSAAGQQLKLLGKLLAHPDDIDEEHAARLGAATFTCASLRPASLQTVFADQAVTVRRWDRSKGPGQEPAGSYQGVAGLAAALKELAEPFDAAPDVRVKFKIVRVDETPQTVTTTAYYMAAGRPADGAVQQNATWTCRWRPLAGDEPPLLEWIGVEDYEEIAGPKGGHTLFADCTEAVLGGSDSFTRQLRFSLDHWRARTDVSLSIRFTGHEGIAVGDVNGDGLDDVFVCQPGGLPNRLLVQNPDGTATDLSAQAGVDFLDLTSSALILDLDNDGDQDLVAAVKNDLFFMLNDGRTRFATVAAAPVPYAHSLSAADYDGDGDLDVYVCCYSDPDKKDSTPVPYHDANTGRANVMLRNDGAGRFTDVTAETGLEVNNSRFSFAASWEDYDNDGDLDLYVANDYGRNNLYRNDGGHFVDAAAAAGVEDISAGMSVSWADYNNDGLMDLYVGNMFSSAGNRISYQRRFKQGDDNTVRAHYRRHARGNSLFENAGDGTFHDVSVQAAVTMGRWAWSSNFIDLNNDGLEDIFVANGFVTNDNTKDL